MLSPIPTKAVPQAARVQFKNESDEKRVSNFTMSFLKYLANSADVMLLMVTSTSRSEKEQAQAMYDKVKQGKIDNYAKEGTSVQKIAQKGVSSKELKSTTIDKMLTQIDKVGFTKVSQHAGVPGLEVIDISLKYLSAQEQVRLLKVIRRRFGSPVYKLGHPGGPKPATKYEFKDHDCYHIAIMQIDQISTGSA